MATHSRLFVAALIAMQVVLMSRIAQAYWEQFDRSELVRVADHIAVVSIEKVQKTKVHDRWWAYDQRATARVVQVIKGHLPRRIPIYAREDFICSSTNYESGRNYLVFLSEVDVLSTTNQAGGQFRIGPDSRVEWLPIDTWHEPRQMNIWAVIDEIRFLLDQRANRELQSDEHLGRFAPSVVRR
jgi:hypothetical protein